MKRSNPAARRQRSGGGIRCAPSECHVRARGLQDSSESDMPCTPGVPPGEFSEEIVEITLKAMHFAAKSELLTPLRLEVIHVR